MFARSLYEHTYTTVDKRKRPTRRVPLSVARQITTVIPEVGATGSLLRTQDRLPRPHWSPSTWH